MVFICFYNKIRLYYTYYFFETCLFKLSTITWNGFMLIDRNSPHSFYEVCHIPLYLTTVLFINVWLFPCFHNEQCCCKKNVCLFYNFSNSQKKVLIKVLQNGMVWSIVEKMWIKFLSGKKPYLLPFWFMTALLST